MNIVLDANILFSALIKDSTTRRMILEYDGPFLFPAYIFEELEKHKTELIRKSCLTKDEFNQLLSMLLKKVSVVPNEVLYPFRKEAYEAVKDIDPDDVLFVACVLAYPNSVLWSDDKKLKKLMQITVFNTKEILNLLAL
jgi:predicted nucleic acid-binding protein